MGISHNVGHVEEQIEHDDWHSLLISLATLFTDSLDERIYILSVEATAFHHAVDNSCRQNHLIDRVRILVERFVVIEFSRQQEVGDKLFLRQYVFACLRDLAKRRNDVNRHIGVLCVNKDLRIHLRGNLFIVELGYKQVECRIESFDFTLGERIFESFYVSEQSANERRQLALGHVGQRAVLCKYL